MPTTSSVVSVIQITVAPVFLLSAVAAVLVLLTTRLGRIVDRARILEDRLPTLCREERSPVVEELLTLGRRLRLIQWAVTLGTACAPLICLLIVSAFLGIMLPVRVSWVVAGLFMTTMAVFAASLLVFLREVFLAMATLRVSLPVGEDALSTSRGTDDGNKALPLKLTFAKCPTPFSSEWPPRSDCRE